MKLIIFLVLATVMSAAYVRAAVHDSKKVELGIDVIPDPAVSYVVIDSLQSYNIRQDTVLSVPVFIYRGSTLKRTMYVWVEDLQGKMISSKAKFSMPERFSSYNLSANLSFSGCNPDGIYRMVAEGLDLEAVEEVSLFFEDCEGETGAAGVADPVNQGDISFEILELPKEVVSGENFTTRILMRNPSGSDLEIDAWSYVYRASRCVSGDREGNLKTVNFPSHSNVTFDLENTVSADAGVYSLKVLLLRSDRKVPKEFTFPLTVLRPGSGGGDERYDGDDSLVLQGEFNSAAGDAGSADVQKRKIVVSNISGAKQEDDRSGIVFKSSSAKARGLTVYFMIILLALVLVALVMKRL